MTGKNWGQIPRSRAAMEHQRLLRQQRVRMTVEKLANECLAARDLLAPVFCEAPGLQCVRYCGSRRRGDGTTHGAMPMASMKVTVETSCGFDEVDHEHNRDNLVKGMTL